MNVHRGGFQAVAADGTISPEGEARDWFTAAELAELQLPGLPGDKRSLNRRAREENWALRCDSAGEPLSRLRVGRGGNSIEYHVSLLPGAARLELARRGLSETRPEPAITEPASVTSWRWYGLQTAKSKAVAERRAGIVAEVELLTDAGLTDTAAVAEIVRRHGVGKSTVWDWMKMVQGVAPSDRLPALCPRYRGGGREAEIDPFLWNVFVSDFLRPSAPTLAACYDRTAEIAAERGLSVPSQVTFRRRVEREVPRAVLIERRAGPDALRRSIPAQRRTVDHLHALEIVNIDGHKFDVLVVPPGGDPRDKKCWVRPVAVAIQDILSSKILAWCIDLSENAIQTQLAFGELFRRYGLPGAVLMDNGRAFASKQISGAAKTRFRGKIKDDEPTGVLMALDINPTWALPYRGQSKPIERAFRDLCERVSKHPDMEGAYTGNSTANKPHNYGERAIRWDDFVAHVDREIARHNAKTGRRGRHYAGRSFDQVFAESYAVAPISKATPEQLHMAMLSAAQKMVKKQTSEIELFGNRYWAPELHQLAGTRVMVRYDPMNLHSEIHVFGLDGRFLLTAPVVRDTGFNSEAGSKTSAKRNAEFRKLTRRQEELLQLIDAEAVAALQPDAPVTEMPAAGVVRPVRHRGQTAAALKAVPEPIQKQEDSPVFTALDRMSNPLRLVE